MIALLTLAACDAEPEAAANEAPGRPIDWVRVERGSTVQYRALPGVVEPVERAPLSFEVDGTIRTLTVEIGDHFAAGEVLGTLDTETLRLALAERQSELAEAEAARDEAAANYARQTRLLRDGWVSDATHETAEASRNTAMSRVEMAAARLAIAHEDLTDATLRAPYAGIVTARLAEPSQRVAMGETVLEVQSNSGGFEVRVAVPETVIDRLAYGSRHEVRLPALADLRLDGLVKDIGAEAAAANAFAVTLALEPARTDLRSGMTAEVIFALPQPDAIDVGVPPDNVVEIPITAFVAAEADTRVAYVYDASSGRVERREIDIVDVTADRAVVGSGLQAGEIIAARGVEFLRDGQPVTLLGQGVARYNP